MKIKIERSQKEKSPKKKKERTLSVGKLRKRVLALWLVLLCSVSFGVYKNFTAIDQQTTHEKTILKETLVDTSGLQSYVKSFAEVYFTWQNKKDALEERTKKMSDYLTSDLQQLNTELIRADIPTNSVAKDIQIIQVKRKNAHTYQVTFSLQQEITEGKKKSFINSTYEVTVHQDSNGDKVITQNPTMTARPRKSSYEQKQEERTGTIDSNTTEEVTSFLETFFKLYPKATKEELAYYVKTDSLTGLDRNLVFSKIDTLALSPAKAGNVSATVSIEYLDQETKAIQIFQYRLKLGKQKNWIILATDSI